MTHNPAHDDLPEAPASGTQWRPPSLDVARLDRQEEGHFIVVLPSGDSAPATLAPGVSPALAAECLREQRPMLVRQGGEELVLVGALQTQPSPIVERDGVVLVTGREVRLEAERRLDLEVGPTRLTLERGGKLSLLGERLTMHIASLIKLIASKVELP